MSKLLFFDIDGTLAYPGQSPSASTVAAIQSARRNGHKVFVSTGRTMDSIPLAVASIGFDGGIFSSGGVIALNNKVIIQHYMHDDVVHATRSTLQRNNILYTLETAYGKFNTENAYDLISQVDFSTTSETMRDMTTNVLFDPTAIPISRYSGQPIHKIAYYSADMTIAQLLYSELNSIAKVIPFNNIPGFPLATGEISDYAVNKGQALKDICEYLGTLPSDCIAFGDSMNDIEILNAAGIGVAMENAEADVQEVANMVCGSCENEGIAKALQDLGLI